MMQGTLLDLLLKDTMEQFLVVDMSTLFLIMMSLVVLMVEYSAMTQLMVLSQHLQVGQHMMQGTLLDLLLKDILEQFLMVDMSTLLLIMMSLLVLMVEYSAMTQPMVLSQHLQVGQHMMQGTLLDLFLLDTMEQCLMVDMSTLLLIMM